MPNEIIRVFVCYSHADDQWLAENGLIPRLQKNLKRVGVEFWWDREKNDGVRGGDAWRSRIRTEIDHAHIAILLISDDFASSDFISEDELPRIQERWNEGGLSVIPVLARSISELAREHLPWVFELQIVPSEQMSLIACKENETRWDATYKQLLDTIYDRVKQYRARSAPSSAPRPPAAKPLRTAASATQPRGDGILKRVKDTFAFAKPEAAAPVSVFSGFVSKNEGRPPLGNDSAIAKQRALIDTAIRTTLKLQSQAPLDRAERARVGELSFCDERIEFLQALSKEPSFTDVGASVLADPETGLNGLATLNLTNTKVTDTGLKDLARRDTGLKGLASLTAR